MQSPFISSKEIDVLVEATEYNKISKIFFHLALINQNIPLLSSFDTAPGCS